MLKRQQHVEFVKKCLKTKDIYYYLTEQDRLATLFWALNSLKLLEDPHFYQVKQEMLDYTLSCLKKNGGFGPNPSFSTNIVATFNALQIFYLYDHPFYDERTVDYILGLQKKDGAFTFDSYGDTDTRLDCCAILSLKLLSVMKKYKLGPSDSSGFDKNELKSPIDEDFLRHIRFNKNSAVSHILSCYNLDGGFGQIPGSESHGAQVFCVLSSLKMLKCLGNIDKLKIIDFLVNRQLENGGLCGRVNKQEDVCYSFWILASLNILNADQFIDREKLFEFILSCQDDGGFSDRPGNEPDLFHLMYSLASMSLLKKCDIKEIDPCFAL